MTFWEKPLVDRLAVGASNVSKAWREGTVVRLAGWEHQAMQEAESALRAAARLSEHPTPTQYAPELVAKTWNEWIDWAEDTNMPYDPDYRNLRHVLTALNLVSDLPQEVDPDEQEASELVKKLSREGFIFGNTDQAESVAAAGIKRGRQLERGDAA